DIAVAVALEEQCAEVAPKTKCREGKQGSTSNSGRALSCVHADYSLNIISICSSVSSLPSRVEYAMLIACLNRLSLREHANFELGIRATASRGRPSGRKAGNVGLRALYHPGPRKAANVCYLLD